MKKQLLIVALLLSGGAYAQSLTVVNHNSRCPVSFDMIGEALTESDGICGMGSNTIVLGPGQTAIWSTPGDFANGVASSATPVVAGYAYEVTPIAPTTWATVTDFIYTDVNFQFACPLPCNNSGGNMERRVGGTCTIGNPYWGPLLGGGSSGTWTGTPVGNVTNVEIDFY